ncbi:hypothetical protein GCM10023231_02570 [Olivibacter ginsenosidimutans]|uniref:Cytochrome c domain-containing protein n=1 Tax=Olivibacter ginsenosidimutans TaxID=1176537 RepID=A0ABP9AFT0_9SPHI
MKSTFVFYGWCILFVMVVMHACQGKDEIKKAQFFTNGKSLYHKTCENCHGDGGEGLGNLYPPLGDTASIRSKQNRLACMVKYGIHEPLTIDNRLFDTEMPANATLSEQEIAYILTYMGNSFGNELGLITTEEVAQQLKNCRNDK